MKNKKTKEYTKGPIVYEKGNIQITLDCTAHNNGFWKKFDKKTAQRLGIYDFDLITRTGD